MKDLSAAQRLKVRRLSAPKAAEEAGELNVVPFLDIIVNVMMFVLATLAITFTSTADVSPPQPTPRRGVPPPSLGLSVLVVDDGFSVKASGGNVAPGCVDTGSGLAVGNVDGRYDFASLQRCAAKLKLSSHFADEHTVTISASPAIRYETIIATMDAVRDDFPDVSFGVAR
jgi:biopolymer transport protein TolR